MNRFKCLVEVPVYKIFVYNIGEVFFVCGYNSHNARDRLQVLLEDIFHTKSKGYNMTIQSTVRPSEAIRHLNILQRDKEEIDI